MKKSFKISGIQIVASKDEKDTLRRATDLIGMAADEGSMLAALPPFFSKRWFLSKIDKKNFSLAETTDGPTITAVREIAQKKKISVVTPIFEKDGSEYFNTAVIVSHDGSIVGTYRKVHVPELPLWEEKSYFTPGSSFPVFELPFAKIGVLNCRDIFFPEAFRVLALKGAELIVAPTASAYKHSCEKWERAIQGASHANGFYVLRVNRVGPDGDLNFYGRSFCSGPDGEFVIKPAGASEGVVIANIDLNIVKSVRNEWAFLKDRRPELYNEITKGKES